LKMQTRGALYVAQVASQQQLGRWPFTQTEMRGQVQQSSVGSAHYISNMVAMPIRSSLQAELGPY